MMAPRRKSLAPERLAALRARLDEVQSQFQASQEIRNDPVHHALRFDSSADREVAALIAAVFAYGNVRQIQTTLDGVFELLGPRPAKTLKESSGHDWKARIPQAFKHRFNTAEDLGILLTWIGEALRQSGTLESFFCESLREDLDGNDGDIGPSLDSFVRRLTTLPCKPYRAPDSKGALFFFPKPSDKSACKRLLLFLRWVAGHGPMDLNLWTRVPRKKLLIPVDTHVLRIARHLGLTRRKNNSWRTSQEITEALRLLDPEDPTRFDFALCHLGISRECPSRFDLKVCTKCRMNSLCVTYARNQWRMNSSL